MPRFEFETRLPCRPASLFDFLLRPQNVARISDPNTGLSIVSAPEIVEVGSRIKFQLMGYGSVQTAVHEITEVLPAARIMEVQVEGPVKAWRHEHRFEADGGGGVRMLDLIDFEPPGGLLGFIATASRISSSLEDGFFYRQQELERLVAGGELR
jgi:ligand-binding SRPBCC domain-containing protein